MFIVSQDNHSVKYFHHKTANSDRTVVVATCAILSLTLGTSVESSKKSLT